MVSAAFITHRGTFNTGQNGDAEKPFTSTQQGVMQRPGFVWDGRWSGHQTQHGMKVPGGGEVAWLLPGSGGSGVRDKPHWRGTITALRHGLAVR